MRRAPFPRGAFSATEAQFGRDPVEFSFGRSIRDQPNRDGRGATPVDAHLVAFDVGGKLNHVVASVAKPAEFSREPPSVRFGGVEFVQKLAKA